MECEVCADLGYITEEGNEYAIAKLCSCRSPCHICLDKGFILDTYTRPPTSRSCECKHLRTRVFLFNQARIPAKMHSRTIENFEDHSTSQLYAHNLVMRYRTAYHPKANGIIFYGTPGTGKTHLMCALLRYFTLEKGITCMFCDFFHLLEDLRNALANNQPIETIIDPLIEADVLAIDELGKGRASEWEISVCDQLVSRRYNARKTILATTNFLCKDAENGVHLRERVGDRIFSRLSEMCQFVEVSGPDFRILKSSP